MAATPAQAPSRPDLDIADRAKDSGSGEGRIRCPKCGWSPRQDDRWMCSCGHVWNTFDTGGVCPACLKQWTETCCPACHKWSPHSDWYPKC